MHIVYQLCYAAPNEGALSNTVTYRYSITPVILLLPVLVKILAFKKAYYNVCLALTQSVNLCF